MYGMNAASSHSNPLTCINLLPSKEQQLTAMYIFRHFKYSYEQCIYDLEADIISFCIHILAITHHNDEKTHSMHMDKSFTSRFEGVFKCARYS